MYSSRVRHNLFILVLLCIGSPAFSDRSPHNAAAEFLRLGTQLVTFEAAAGALHLLAAVRTEGGTATGIAMTVFENATREQLAALTPGSLRALVHYSPTLTIDAVTDRIYREAPGSPLHHALLIHRMERWIAEGEIAPLQNALRQGVDTGLRLPAGLRDRLRETELDRSFGVRCRHLVDQMAFEVRN